MSACKLNAKNFKFKKMRAKFEFKMDSPPPVTGQSSTEWLQLFDLAYRIHHCGRVKKFLKIFWQKKFFCSEKLHFEETPYAPLNAGGQLGAQDFGSAIRFQLDTEPVNFGQKKKGIFEVPKNFLKKPKNFRSA